jgi:two-component system phosphate regulon sensor histidine kinase PhoR
MLVKEIIPQISFSIFLSLLTIGAFLILYKNLLTQQDLVRQKNEFISNVTHELKTPVATVSVALEALKNFHALENPKRTEAYLDLAQNELKRLSTMTDKILNLSVSDSKGIGLESKQLDLQMLMQQVIASMKLVWEKQKATVHTQVEGNDFKLTGNKIHLSNVIYNLLDNAVKYSKAPADVHIILKDEGHQLVLTVKDHGIGIPEEYKKKVFENFFRVPQGDVHNVKGYGLGLSYVSQVIQAHQGRVAVESTVGKGSSFSIKLPKYGSH